MVGTRRAYRAALMVSRGLTLRIYRATVAGMNISHALDSIGVGRPLGDGRRWTRAAFCAATGIPPVYLCASRAGTERQQRVIEACTWGSSILGGEMPPGWRERAEVRELTIRILRAWCAANEIGEEIGWLRGWLVRWGAALPEGWLTEARVDEIRNALARESWAGVLQMVRS